jgi:protein-disulfide isomerase
MEHNSHQPESFEQINVVAQAPKRDYFLPVSIIVAAVLIGGAILFATFYKGGSAAPVAGGAANNPNAPAAQAAAPGVNTSTIMTLTSRDAILGDANAPVTIIGYGDYQCPFCTRFFSQTEPSLIAKYVTTGKARFVFRNLAFLGPESAAAAQAGECANDQGKEWAYHDALYSAKISDETAGGSENDGYFTRAVFLKLASQTGLNVATFTSCIDTNKYAALVTQEKTDAANVGVNSTPTFFVNGTLVQGAQPLSAFQAIIDPLLK